MAHCNCGIVMAMCHCSRIIAVERKNLFERGNAQPNLESLHVACQSRRLGKCCTSGFSVLVGSVA
jgi:hypothetical protein